MYLFSDKTMVLNCDTEITVYISKHYIFIHLSIILLACTVLWVSSGADL